MMQTSSTPEWFLLSLDISMFKKHSFLLVFLVTSIVSVYAAMSRTVDEALLEVEMGKRVEGILDKLIGSQRSIVDVKVTLKDMTESDIGKLRMLRHTLPGMATSQMQDENEQNATDPKNRFKVLAPLISTMSVTILVDEKLPKEKITIIEKEIPPLIGLNLAKGDLLTVKPIPWKDVLTEEMAIKQVGLSKSSYFVLVLIAVFTGGVVIFFFSQFLGKKLKKISADQLDTFSSYANKMDVARGDLTDSLHKMGEALQQMMQSESGGHGGGAREMSDVLQKLIETQKEVSDSSTDRITEALMELKDSLGEVGGGGPGGGGAGGAGGGGFGGGGAGGTGGGGGEGISKLAAESQDPMTKALAIMNSLKPEEIMQILQDEDAHMKAIVVAHLSPEKSAEFLLALDDENRNTLTTAIAQIPEGDIESLLALKDFLDKKATVIMHRNLLPGKAARAMAKMLSRSLPEVRKSVLDNIRKRTPEVAEEIEDSLFLFDDISKLDDRTIKSVIANIDRNVLIRALKKASSTTKEKILATFTPRSRSILEEDIDVLGEIPFQVCLQAQNIILDRIDILIEEGNFGTASTG